MTATTIARKKGMRTIMVRCTAPELYISRRYLGGVQWVLLVRRVRGEPDWLHRAPVD